MKHNRYNKLKAKMIHCHEKRICSSYKILFS